MWLIDVATKKLEYVGSPMFTAYAILSHRWEDKELTFQDITSGEPWSNYKVETTCQQALKNGFKYVWIDTCCIDKTSSAELSEAINSMYEWYRAAQVCYVYLNDVRYNAGIDLVERGDSTEPPGSRGSSSGGEDYYYPSRDNRTFKTPSRFTQSFIEDFKHSKWFQRGWTLQELLAPIQVRFFDAWFQPIGSKIELTNIISERTGIPSLVLEWPNEIQHISVAQRMSWAARRDCTRVEDRAYSLMGIFGINMALLYGEGENAFFRLQEEIMKKSADHSILAWNPSDRSWRGTTDTFLAGSPDDFVTQTGRIVTINNVKHPPFEVTNVGLRIELPWMQLDGNSLAVLNCRYENDFSGPLALVVKVVDVKDKSWPRRVYKVGFTVVVDFTMRAIHRKLIFVRKFDRREHWWARKTPLQKVWIPKIEKTYQDDSKFNILSHYPTAGSEWQFLNGNGLFSASSEAEPFGFINLTICNISKTFGLALGVAEPSFESTAGTTHRIYLSESIFDSQNTTPAYQDSIRQNLFENGGRSSAILNLGNRVYVHATVRDDKIMGEDISVLDLSVVNSATRPLKNVQAYFRRLKTRKPELLMNDSDSYSIQPSVISIGAERD